MMEKRNDRRDIQIGKVKLVRCMVFTAVIALLCGGVVIQECMAAEGDEAEIEKAIEDFRLAWSSKNIGKVDEVWSHEDDVRFIIYATNISENNHDAHGWFLVRQLINNCFRMGAGSASFRNLSIEMGERGAAVILDSNIGEPHSDRNFALLRKEDDSWKIYLWDTTGLEAAKTGDETGEYVEIVFEAEDGKGANDFISRDPDASGGEYIINMGTTLFEFAVPVADEYTIWGRTHAYDNDHNSLRMSVGSINGIWDVGVSSSWVWNQMNIKLNVGPMIFELGEGTNALSVNMGANGTKLDAIYITNNLSLWAEQIQRRFELTMGYIEEPDTVSALEPQGNMITTWGRIKR